MLAAFTMNQHKEKYEKSVGDTFIEWLNSEIGTEYRFINYPDRAPDLLYSSNGDDLLIEVTSAFYDREHAKFIWKGIREEEDAPLGWSGFNPNRSLAAEIFNRVTEKAKKRYGDKTVLLIEVPPGVTSAEELTEMLGNKQVEKQTPFVGIYVVGNFPIKTHSTGGYRVIPIKKLQSVPGC